MPIALLTLGEDPHAVVAHLAMGLLVMFGTAAVVGTLFRRLRLDVIPGYLLAGAIVGPFALGMVDDSNGAGQIAGLATVLLMFIIGLELDLSGIRTGMGSILAIGIATTGATALAGWGIASVFGMSAPAALVIGMALSLSSTAVLVRVLAARREFRRAHGRVAFGTALVQDLAAVVMLALIPPIALWGGTGMKGLPAAATGAVPGSASLLDFAFAALIGLGGIAIMIVAGRVVLPRLLVYIAKTGSTELVLVVSTAIALAAAIGSAMLGFSPEMGAFLAGFLLAATPVRYQLAGQLTPLRDLLMAVFFVGVGMRVDPAIVAEHWGTVLAGAVGVVVFKAAIIGGASWALGLAPSAAFLTGLYLANAGEFSLVVLSAGANQGVLTPEQSSSVIAVVILTLIASPLLVGPAHAWADWASRLPTSPWGVRSSLREPGEKAAGVGVAPDEALRGHIVIAGFGPVGRNLADRLAALNIPFTVVELNPRTVERQATLGRRVIYGDITNPVVLAQAQVATAEAVLLTVPDDEIVFRACRAVRAIAPHVFIAARTSFLSGRFTAEQLGADIVTVEELATARRMERDVLSALEHRRVMAALAAKQGDSPDTRRDDATPSTA